MLITSGQWVGLITRPSRLCQKSVNHSPPFVPPNGPLSKYRSRESTSSPKLLWRLMLYDVLLSWCQTHRKSAKSFLDKKASHFGPGAQNRSLGTSLNCRVFYCSLQEWGHMLRGSKLNHLNLATGRNLSFRPHESTPIQRYRSNPTRESCDWIWFCSSVLCLFCSLPYWYWPNRTPRNMCTCHG